MERPLDTIVQLQQCLDELAATEVLLNGIPDWMSELHEQYSARKAEIDAFEAIAEEAATERRAANGAIADCNERLKTFQAQISRVRNQREYGALLHEIDLTKQQIKEFEEQGLAALERQETAEKSVAEENETFAELDARYKTELEKWEAEKPELGKTAEKLRGQMEVLRERLTPGTLGQFDRILERHSGRALAEVLKVDRLGKGAQMWHCGACNFRVRPQAVVQIADQGTIVLCDSCRRILFLQESDD